MVDITKSKNQEDHGGKIVQSCSPPTLESASNYHSVLVHSAYIQLEFLFLRHLISHVSCYQVIVI